MPRSGWATIAVTAIVALVGACGGGPASTGPPPVHGIVVGSFDFAESELLAEIYAQALETEGYPVVRRFGVGPRELTLPALEQGLLDLVPEYAGSALSYLGGTPTADRDETVDRLRAALEPRGLVALEPAPAGDTNVFVVTEATAARLGSTSLSGLVPHARQMTFGGPAECQERPLCLRGLEDVYGLRFADFLPLDAGGPLTLQALAEGQVDIGLLFSTSGRLATGGFVALDDDLHLQPAENVVPVMASDVEARFGRDVARILDAVSGSLTVKALQVMNAGLDRGLTPEGLALSWLAANGLD